MRGLLGLLRLARYQKEGGQVGEGGTSRGTLSGGRAWAERGNVQQQLSEVSPEPETYRTAWKRTIAKTRWLGPIRLLWWLG